MRTIWNFVSFLAVVNLLALLMALAWLWQSGRLTRARMHDLRAVFSMPESEAGTLAAKIVSEAEMQRLKEAEEQRRAHPPADSATQISQVAFVQQQHEQAKRRLEDEQRMLARQLEQATSRMEANVAAFEQQRSTWQRDQQDDTQRRIDEQFLQAVRQLEQLPAKQAKGVLEKLVADKNIDQAVAYLDAMNPRSAAKVLREFKTAGEIALATDLLERLRRFGLPAADAPSSSATSAGARTQQESSDAGTDPLTPASASAAAAGPA